VFGDEDDQTPTAPNEVFSPDAKNIAVSTLRLRAERVNTGNGRVYLIVVRSGTSFATVTVVVAKSSSPANVNAVNAEAAAAKAYADSHNGAAPAGYFVIGDGPIIGNKQ
jgi:exosome complex RNA-binding protein Csl4